MSVISLNNVPNSPYAMICADSEQSRAGKSRVDRKTVVQLEHIFETLV